MRYQVLRTLWHTGAGRHAFPGELISLDHLPAEARAELARSGVVAPEDAAQAPAPIVAEPAEPVQTFIDTARGPVPADHLRGPDISADMPAAAPPGQRKRKPRQTQE